MDSKYCSDCNVSRPLSSFLAQDQNDRVFATCIICRTRHIAHLSARRDRGEAEKVVKKELKAIEREQLRQQRHEEKERRQRQLQVERERLRRQKQEEKEQRQQQQQAERTKLRQEKEAKRANSIEQRQRMEEHQDTLNSVPGPSKKRKRTTSPNQIKHFNDSTAHIPVSRKNTPNLLMQPRSSHHIFLLKICVTSLTTINNK
jgi:hypothetical protein